MHLVELIEVLLDTTVGLMVAAAEDPWIRADLLAAMGVEDSPAVQAELLALQQPLATVPGLDAAAAGGAEVARWLTAATAAWAALDGMSAFGPGEAPGLALALGTTGLQAAFPAAYHLAIGLGLIVPFRPASRPGVDLYDTIDREAVRAFLSAPRDYLAAHLPSLDLSSEQALEASMQAFVRTFGRVLSAVGLVWTLGLEPGGLGVPDEAFLRRMVTLQLWGDGGTAAAGIAVSGVPNGAGQGGLVVVPYGALALETTRGAWTISVTGQVSAGGLQFGGDAGFRVVGGGPAPQLQLTAERLGGELVAGSAAGASVQLSGATIAATAGITAAGLTWSLAGDVSDLRLVIAADEGDGFLRTVLGDRKLEATISLGMVLDAGGGLRFRGSGGLSVPTGVHIALGPLAISRLVASIEAAPDRIGAAITCDLAVGLGPVRVMLDGLGVEVSARLAPAASPGEPWLRHGFKGPDGAGVAIDAGSVSGAGLLTRAGDVYTGALALDVHGITVTAYGALDATGPGYALTAVVSTHFHPIPIGLGFTLDGVGGLLCVNRRMDVDALRSAVRGPGIGDIFFPADPVGQAARLTGDLSSLFPGAGGRHVFGPAARLGWGTPALLRATVAVLLEVPSPVRLVLLGTASVALPTEDEPIVELNVDVVGEVDFARRTAAVDASLRDSKIAGFAITGDLALRMAWGDPPSFALAVGGFHSQFRPPPGFPALRRVHIPIGAGENPRLDIQGFLALTSNTVQVGASVELYAAAGPLNIVGNVGFEALIQFVPFEFRADLWAGVALRRGTRVLAGVHLDGTLRGPSPWRFAGEACLSLWLTDLCVGFDATFGHERAVELPAREIWPQLEAALEDPRSWSSTMPPAAARAVTTAPPIDEAAAAAAAARIDPAAALTVRQKVVPLNRTIERFAQVPPSGVDRFQVASAQLGAVLLASPPLVDDWFAAAQFEALTDAERLSRPGYEKMVAGVTLASDRVTTGAELIKALEYETITFPDPEPAPIFYRPTLAAQLAGTATGANRLAPLRAGAGGAYAPPRDTPALVTLEEERYVIASTSDLAPRLDIVGAVGRGDAERALDAYLAAHPSARGALQVVPQFEVEPVLP